MTKKINHLADCDRLRGSKDCLCDVHVGTPVPYMNINFARDYYAAESIIKYLEPSRPWTVDSMLDFFTTACRIHDVPEVYIPPVKNEDGWNNPSVANAMVTTEVKYFIAARITEGVAGKQIRQELLEQFGLTISSQYLSTIKKRLWKETA